MPVRHEREFHGVRVQAYDKTVQLGDQYHYISAPVRDLPCFEQVLELMEAAYSLGVERQRKVIQSALGLD